MPADSARSESSNWRVQDIALSGRAGRFDYQSIDPVARRLSTNYMNSGRPVVFDLNAARAYSVGRPHDTSRLLAAGNMGGRPVLRVLMPGIEP